MTAIVTLGTLWLNDYVSPSDFVSFPYMTAWKVTPTKNGSTRTYAGGRVRAISTAGSTTVYAATLHACTRAQIDWLTSHVGRVVCIRDDRGRRDWGIYWSNPVDEHRHNIEGDIELSLNNVTVSEAV